MDVLDILPYELWRAVFDAIESPVYSAFGENARQWHVDRLKRALRHVCKVFDRIVRETVTFKIYNACNPLRDGMTSADMHQISAWKHAQYMEHSYLRNSFYCIDARVKHWHSVPMMQFFSKIDIGDKLDIQTLTLQSDVSDVQELISNGDIATQFIADGDKFMSHGLRSASIRNFSVNMDATFRQCFDMLFSTPSVHNLRNLQTLSIRLANCNLLADDNFYDMTFLSRLKHLDVLEVGFGRGMTVKWPETLDDHRIHTLTYHTPGRDDIDQFPACMYSQSQTLRTLAIYGPADIIRDATFSTRFPLLERLMLYNMWNHYLLDANFILAIQQCAHLQELSLDSEKSDTPMLPIVSTTLRKLKIQFVAPTSHDFTHLPYLEELLFIHYNYSTTPLHMRSNGDVRITPHLTHFSSNWLIPAHSTNNITHLHWIDAKADDAGIDLTHLHALRFCTIEFKCAPLAIRFPKRTIESLSITHALDSPYRSKFWFLLDKDTSDKWTRLSVARDDDTWTQLRYLEVITTNNVLIIKMKRVNLFKNGIVEEVMATDDQISGVEREQLLNDKQFLPALQNIVLRRRL